MNFTINRNIENLMIFPAECAENVIIGSQSVGLESFQALCLPCNKTNTLGCQSSDMRFCVFLQKHKINRLMALLQVVEAATHH